MIKKSTHTDTTKYTHTRQHNQTQKTGDLKNIQKTIIKMATVCPYLSVIILNIKGLHSPVKRHRMPEWVKNGDTLIWCL